MKSILLSCLFLLSYYTHVVQCMSGGTPATSNTQYPYHVSIRDSSKSYVCGACIIGSRWVLTAAHCVDWWMDPSYVRINTIDIAASGASTHIDKTIGQIIQHYDYSPYTYENDIALIRVSTITFSPSLQPLLIPHFNIGSGVNLVATGWGTIQTGQTPLKLRYLTTKTTSSGTCWVTGGIVPGNICTRRTGYKALCPGDDGGPLVNNKYVHAIMSWNDNCVSGDVDVNTRVYEYVDWIHQNAVP